VQWLLPEHADVLIGFGPQSLPVRHYLAAAAGLGIEMRACSQAMHALGLGREALVPQCAGLGGLVAFLGRGKTRPGARWCFKKPGRAYSRVP
jgi:predicted peroxiredoxin